MKASDAIDQLQLILDKYGDLDIKTHTKNGEFKNVFIMVQQKLYFNTGNFVQVGAVNESL